MRKYESILILDPRLNDGEVEKELKKYQELLTSKGAVDLKAENWGRKEIAYPVKKRTSGIYLIFKYSSERHEIVQELNSLVRIADEVIKFQSSRLEEKDRKYKGNPLALKLSQEGKNEGGASRSGRREAASA